MRARLDAARKRYAPYRKGVPPGVTRRLQRLQAATRQD